MDQHFLSRASRIPHHGLGLSVDVYSPCLFDLLTELSRHHLHYGYLEIFKAHERALERVRSSFPDSLLEYHAEGLWVTQPDLWAAYPIEQEIQETATHLQVLGSSWCNHECASKQMTGYSFGTYLPPVLTVESANVTAGNAVVLQQRMDALLQTVARTAPLLLLETPPLTYFGFGDMPYPEFFQTLTELVPCGLVLDIGHVWTVYRYTGQWRSQTIEQFLKEFLDTFPLTRVVQIHIAGLAPHQRDAKTDDKRGSLPPAWIDSHGSPIPDVLFDMLDQVLAHPGLTHLKGLAMEVDTKSMPVIVEEYRRFIERYAWWKRETEQKVGTVVSAEPVLKGTPLTGCCAFDNSSSTEALTKQYRDYVQVVRKRASPSVLPGEKESVDRDLERYSETYLPFEILEWGGDLREMFPRTVAHLQAKGISLSRFLDFWFEHPRPNHEPFDFFLLKIQRFVEFVEMEDRSALELAKQEALDLRNGYELANAL